jgi:hypothetical protein
MRVADPTGLVARSSTLVRTSPAQCVQARHLEGSARDVRAAAAGGRRARRATWIGGGAPDLRELSEARECVRHRLTQGRLRRDAGTAHVLTIGTGRPCHACERPVERGQAGTLVPFRDGGLVRFHAMCFWAWQIERHVAAAPPPQPA